MKPFDFSRFLFYFVLLVLLVTLSFAAGYVSSRNQNRVYRFLESSWQQIEGSFSEVREEAGTVLKVSPDHFLQPARFDGVGVTLNRADRHGGELVFLSGFFDGDNELRLIDREGRIIVRWPVRFSEIFAGQTHRDPPTTDWNIDTHGALMLPDGSVVFNFEYGGTAKLDRCGEILWKIEASTHHSVEQAEGGGFWIPVRRFNRHQKPYKFYPFRPPFQEDFIMRVSDRGEILSEVSVPGIFYESDMEALLTATGYQFKRSLFRDREIVHLNKIAELSVRDSATFPMFAAGDLLLSLRDYNMVLVVDGETLRIKWHQVGPWLRQHDPEFSASGTIDVFNNNVYAQPRQALEPRAWLTTARQSNIVSMDPLTREFEVRFGDIPGQEMLTTIRGKHELTPSGGYLVTEFEGGRVLEADASGDIVWEYVNRYDDNQVAEITEARLYPRDYFSVTDWSCN